VSEKPAVREYLGISLFWFAISLFWGAMLSIVVPDRVEALVGKAHKDHTLAIVIALGAVVATCAQIVFGALSDRSRHPMGRRRPFMIAGTLLTTLALLLFPPARTVAALIGAYIAIQLSLNIANGPYQALLPDRIPPSHHGTASAFMGVFQLVGRIGGVFAAAAILAHFRSVGDPTLGLWALVVIFALLLNIFMIVNVLVVREDRLDHEGPGVGETIRNIFRIPLRPYPSFTWLLISRFGIMMGVYNVLFFLLYYVQDTLHQGAAAGGTTAMLSMIAGVTGLIGTLVAGVLSDRFSKKHVLYASNAISIAAGLTFAVAHSLMLAYVAAAVFGAGFGAFCAVDWALACNLLPEEARAKYMGLWGVSDCVPQVVAPIIAGLVAAAVNSALGPGVGYRAVMMVSMAFYLIGTLALHHVRERPLAPASAVP
jgi:MFS family permease